MHHLNTVYLCGCLKNFPIDPNVARELQFMGRGKYLCNVRVATAVCVENESFDALDMINRALAIGL